MEIDEYIKIAKTQIPSVDKINEFKCTSKTLYNQNYQGLIMSYIEAIKVWV